MKKIYQKLIGMISCMGLLMAPALLNAQETVFQHIYQSSFNQSARDVIPTNDGGYILAGMTENFTLGDTNIFIVKTNNLGDTTWTSTFGGALPDYPNSIIQDGDGNFLVTGYTKSFGAGGTDSWLIKLNGSGDTMWTKTYGGPGEDEAKDIIPSGDGNYILAGRTGSYPSLYFDAYLMKVSPSGNVIWTKTYGGTQFDGANSVELCTDGGYAFAGQTNSAGAGGGDLWLVRTNASGDSLWAKTYGGAAFDEAKYLIANSDGTFVLCGNNYGSGDADIQVIKTDATGTVIWDKTYGGDDKDVGKTIDATTDGGYIVSSISRSFGWINPDMWLLKLNSGGDTVWARNYGSFDHEHAYAAKQTADNGFIAVGHSKSYGPNMKIMFIKLDENGTFGTVSVDQLMAEEMIEVYPNPSNGLVQIGLNGDLSSYTFRVSNSLGQTVYSESETAGAAHTRSIDLTGNKPGIYFMNIQTGNKSVTKKLILR